METTPDIALYPQERLENAQYDLSLAKRAWSGRSVEDIERDLEAARARERAEQAKRVPLEQFGEQSRAINRAVTARFDLMKERTRALAVKACEAELEEAEKAPGVIL